MISKIVITDFPPFKLSSSLNLKKFNLIIGNNGVGKTRIFKTLNEGFSHKQNFRYIDDKLQECFQVFEDKESIATLYTNTAAPNPYFTLGIDKQMEFLYISDRRIPTSSHISNPRYELTNLENGLFSNFLFKPECVEFTNNIYKKLFKRQIDVRKIYQQGQSNSVDKFSWKRNDKLIDPLDDGYGILQSLGIFQLLYLASPDTTIVIEEPSANLHPSVIGPLINEMITIASNKNIQLVIITHDIITALIFFKKISNKDADTAAYRFEQIDEITHIHNVEKDNITSSLEDFLGEFPEKSDITLLKELAGFNPEFK